jgi:hypothetical protein
MISAAGTSVIAASVRTAAVVASAGASVETTTTAATVESTTSTAAVATTATMLSEDVCGKTHECERNDTGKKSVKPGGSHIYLLHLAIAFACPGGQTALHYLPY